MSKCCRRHCRCSSLLQGLTSFDDNEADAIAEASAAVEEQSANDRYRATDDLLRAQRLFPAGTTLTIKVYDPAGSGAAVVAVDGERLAKLVVGAREMYRYDMLRWRCAWRSPLPSSLSICTLLACCACIPEYKAPVDHCV